MCAHTHAWWQCKIYFLCGLQFKDLWNPAVEGVPAVGGKLDVITPTFPFGSWSVTLEFSALKKKCRALPGPRRSCVTQHCWHTQTRRAPASIVIRHTLPGGVYQLQQEVIGGARFRDRSIVTGKYFSGLNHQSIESKWPGYLNFLTEEACDQ